MTNERVTLEETGRPCRRSFTAGVTQERRKPELSVFDVLLPVLPVVFCGINPNIRAAETGRNFESATNRFWQVLHEAGFTSTRLNAHNDRSLLEYGCSITAAVGRGTRKASELRSADFRSGHDLLRAKLLYFGRRSSRFLGKLPAQRCQVLMTAIGGRSRLDIPTLTFGFSRIQVASTAASVSEASSSTTRLYEKEPTRICALGPKTECPNKKTHWTMAFR